MKSISWDSNSYYIDGKPDFLVSGEFHYFRVPREDWRRRLELLIEAGGNCVATYIPWILHEPEEGDIRFGDIPERDLEGFLQLCKELGVFVICRPGPYQYSEMRYDGLPGWLCENYPAIHARDINNRPFRNASVSYLHPVFLQKTRIWYETVCPLIAKYSISKGGTVAFVQFDNEMSGIHVWFSSGYDYNREAMGIGEASGRYTMFIKHRYGTLENLNKAYDGNYKSFCEAEPVPPNNTRTFSDRRKVKDYQDFYFTSLGEYGQILVSWMRELGIDCDIVHNSPGPNYNSSFLETVKKLGKDFMLGTDHYYNLSPDWEQNNPTPQHAAKVFISSEMIRLMGFPVTIMELPGGSASDWPPFLAEDANASYYMNLAFGMKGLNYYIFTGGPNPPGVGRFGDIYDYGAGIGADGDIRKVYETQKAFGAFLAESSWLAEAERECDFYIGLDWEQSRSSEYFRNAWQFRFCSNEAW